MTSPQYSGQQRAFIAFSQGAQFGQFLGLDFRGSGFGLADGGRFLQVTFEAPEVNIEDEGVPEGAADTLNFTGAGVVASVVAGVATINIPGSTTPTGTGFTHITAGVQDAAAKLVENADVAAAAAIAGTKIAPNFGSQDILTTGSFGNGTQATVVNGNNTRLQVGGTTYAEVNISFGFIFSPSSNPMINGAPATFGGGSGMLIFNDRAAAPTGNPVGGGFDYSEAGAGTWRGSGGTTTTYAPA